MSLYNHFPRISPTFSIKTFICPHCEREFKGKRSFIEHISSKHNNEKRFVCSQCPETFVSKYLKNVHERCHNGEQELICEQCGKRIATVQGLHLHRRKHNGDYQYRYHSYKLYNDQLWVVIIQFMTTSQNQSYNDVSLGVGPVARASITTS